MTSSLTVSTPASMHLCPGGRINVSRKESVWETLWHKMTSHGGILRDDHAGTRTGSREGPTGAAGAPRPLWEGRVGTGRLCSAQGWSQHRDEEAEYQAPSPQCVILKDTTCSFRPEGTIAGVQGWDLAVTTDIVQRKHKN